jgi:hypothetical protein
LNLEVEKDPANMLDPNLAQDPAKYPANMWFDPTILLKIQHKMWTKSHIKG